MTIISTDDMMKIIIADMQNIDIFGGSNGGSSDFINTMVSMSNLKNNEEMNNNIKKLQESLDHNAKFSMFFNIYHEKTFDASNEIIHLENSQGYSFFELEEPAKTIDCIVNDNNNHTVFHKVYEDLGSGLYQFSWDGRNEKGLAVNDGNYKFEVNAYNQNGDNIEVKNTISDTVKSVIPITNSASCFLKFENELMISNNNIICQMGDIYQENTDKHRIWSGIKYLANNLV